MLGNSLLVLQNSANQEERNFFQGIDQNWDFRI